MLENITTAILAFVSTNIDDIFILMLFFARDKHGSANIVLGQYAGFITLVVISLIGSYIGNFIDQRYVGLLGFFPIYLAVRDITETIKGRQEDQEIEEPRLGILSIAAITVANGGDNIGVYVPLLTILDSQEKIQLIIVFLIMVYVWCITARYLAHHPLAARPIKRYGALLMPVVLFLLGLFILYESKSFTLFI